LKKLTLIILLSLITFTSVSAYAITQYITTRQVNEQATIGNTIQYEQGIEILNVTRESGNLTYYTILEDSENKHTLTYTYEYSIIQGYELSVTSSNVVILSTQDNGTSIDIEFGLKQENSYTQGDVLDITFNFTLEEITLGAYTASNPLNVNTATKAELESIGFSSFEAAMTVDVTNVYTVTSFINLESLTGISGLDNRYKYYVELGIIIFE